MNISGRIHDAALVVCVKKTLSLFLLCLSSLCMGDEDPLPIGNLALPFTQAPGPLIGFGENIVNEGQFQLFLFGDAYLGHHQSFIDAVPGLLYGLTDDFSVFLNVPITPGYRQGVDHSRGLEDLFLQLEYAFYTHSERCYVDQGTVVANCSAPTGSSHVNPPTGSGSPVIFIGTTLSRVMTDWFFFTAYGGYFPTSHKGTQFGNQFLYQYGLGRNIMNTCGWLFAWQVEIDGTLYGRNKFQGLSDPNSGGNVIFATPSLWISSKDWIIQLGVGYAVQQHWKGEQNHNTLLLALNIGRTF